MKTKHLLLLSTMLLFTTFTVVAQNAVDKKPSSDNIPFGKKLPPPDIMNNANSPSGQVTQPNLNKLLTQAIKTHDKNAMKKALNNFRQQSKENNEQGLHANENYANMNSGHTASNSDFHLVKDINALAESNPHSNPSLLTDIHWNIYNDSASYAVLDNVAYFAADDGIHGNEFWRSDGTAEGTYMVKDIVPGLSSSAIFDITAVNGKIYFTNYTTGGAWVSDGTESGTHSIPSSNEPVGYFAMGKNTYFITDAGNGNPWAAFWETDGTTAGTKQVIDVGDMGLWISEPKAVNGLFFFTMYTFETGGWDLWRSDGTQTGTYSVASFPYLDTIPAQLTKYNNKLYFSANDGTGRKLWVSDGTVAGTTLAPGNHNIFVDADILGTSFPILNNVLYIPGEKAARGNGLYKYDASSSAGLVKIKDFAPIGDTAFIVPLEMQAAHNTLYYKVTNYTGGLHDELWSSKGTTASTQPVYKLKSGETIKYLHDGSGIFYFVKYDKLLGTELWRTYETSSGIFPLPVSDIFKGPTSSYPSYLTAFNGKLIFSAADEKKGNELFITGGNLFNTTLVKDINTVATTTSDAGINWYGYDGMVALGKDVLFNANERVHGRELYKSDGTAAGTELLNDVIPGEAGFYINEFISKNNAAYFIAVSSGVYSIYTTNGTKNSLRKITPDYDYIQSFSVADNGLMFYVVYNYETLLYELWRTDGTIAGTLLLSSSLPSGNYLNIIGNTAFFTAGDAVHGYELWKSNGSSTGTKMVKDINAKGSSYPGGMYVFNNEVYFAANDSTDSNNGTGIGFWKSDGTKAGTVKLKDIDPWYSYNAFFTDKTYFEAANGILYFSALHYSDGKGAELWKTDGTSQGTKFIKDINAGATGITPYPNYFTNVNGTIFFIGDDGVHGSELWKTDGTKDGTRMVKDITPGVSGSNLWGLTSFAGKLYFQNFVNYTPYFWSSDGTPEGTHDVDDSGIVNVEIDRIFPIGNQLFLSGYTQQYGIELYVGKVNETGKLVVSKTTNEDAVKTSLSFNATLYPNPAINNATLQLTGITNNVSVSVTDINGKTLWQSSINNSKFVRLPTEKYSPGIYFVTVTNGKESKTLKLVKQ